MRKAEIMFGLMQKRKWSAAILTDINMPPNTVKEYETDGHKWTLVTRGKVGIVLNEKLTEQWGKGVAASMTGKGTEGSPARCFTIRIPNDGWRKGLFIVGVYAPTSHHSQTRAREHMYEQIEKLIDKSGGYQTLIIGGDFNAEVGAGKDREYSDVLGTHGDNRRTGSGSTLLEHCRQNQLIVAGSYTRQTERATWWHPRWGSGHELDHFLMRKVDRWMIRSCKTLHQDMPNKVATWKTYCDHEPVEIDLRTDKNWVEIKKQKKE